MFSVTTSILLSTYSFVAILEVSTDTVALTPTDNPSPTRSCATCSIPLSSIGTSTLFTVTFFTYALLAPLVVM